MNIFTSEMIRSELEEIVWTHFISVKETDKLVYSTDWSWIPQMWLDRGERLPTADYIVHPLPTCHEPKPLGGCTETIVSSLINGL